MAWYRVASHPFVDVALHRPSTPSVLVAVLLYLCPWIGAGFATIFAGQVVLVHVTGREGACFPILAQLRA
jgi:hypothetical protein